MNVNTAKRLIKLNEETYTVIAPRFQETRKKPLWQELFVFKSYIKSGDRVLDAGCGSGRLFSLFDDISVEYTGIDANSRLLEYARGASYGENAKIPQTKTFLKGDIRQLPFSDGYFDCVFLVASLNHLPERYHNKALSEAHRVLKKNGVLLMANFNLWRFSLKGKTLWRYKLRELISLKKGEKLGWKDVITSWDNHSLYYYAFTLGELKRACKGRGFYIIDSYYAKNGKRANVFTGNNLVLIAKK